MSDYYNSQRTDKYLYKKGSKEPFKLDLADIPSRNRQFIKAHLVNSTTKGIRKSLIEISTGSGKTRIVSGLISTLNNDYNEKRFLIIVDRREIAYQYKSILEDSEELSGFEITINEKSTGGKFIHIVTIQSLINSKIEDSYDHIFLDGCGRGFARLVSNIEHLNAKVIGFTNVVLNEHKPFFEDFTSFKISYEFLTENYIKGIFESKHKDIDLLNLGEIASLEFFTGDKLYEKDYDFIVYSVFSPGKIILKNNYSSIKTSKSSRYIGGKVKKNSFLPEFIYLLSLQDEYKQQIDLCKKGTAIARISIKSLENILIPNYKAEMQNKIVKNWVDIESLKNNINTVEKQFIIDYLDVNKFRDIIDNLNLKVDPVSSFPSPVATSYYQYINTVDKDKRLKDIFTCYEVTTRFLGISILCALKKKTEFENEIDRNQYLNTINKNLPDIYKPISTGYWNNVIKHSLKLIKNTNSLYADHISDVEEKIVSNYLDILGEYRDSYAHELNSLTNTKINYVMENVEVKLQELLNQFSFISKYPFVYMEADEIRKKGTVWKLLYLIGDTKSKKQDKRDTEEEFYTSLYLYSSFPGKSIELSPLIVYTECPLCNEQEVLFFDFFDKKEGLPIYRGCNKFTDGIKLEKYTEDILEFFNKNE